MKTAFWAKVWGILNEFQLLFHILFYETFNYLIRILTNRIKNTSELSDNLFFAFALEFFHLTFVKLNAWTQFLILNIDDAWLIVINKQELCGS